MLLLCVLQLGQFAATGSTVSSSALQDCRVVQRSRVSESFAFSRSNCEGGGGGGTSASLHKPTCMSGACVKRSCEEANASVD